MYQEETFTADSTHRQHEFFVFTNLREVYIKRTSSTSIFATGGLRSAFPEALLVSFEGDDLPTVDSVEPNVELGALLAYAQYRNSPIFEKEVGTNLFEVQIRVLLTDTALHFGTAQKLSLKLSQAVVGATYAVGQMETPDPVTGSYFHVQRRKQNDNPDLVKLTCSGRSGMFVLPTYNSEILSISFFFGGGGDKKEYDIADLLDHNAFENKTPEYVSTRLAGQDSQGGQSVTRRTLFSGSRDSEYVLIDYTGLDKIEIRTDGTVLEVFDFTKEDLPAIYQGLSYAV